VGNGNEAGKAPLDNADSVDEREAVWVFVGLQGSLVHQATDREVSHEQAIKLLPHQVRGLAGQHDPDTPQVSLQLVQSGLSGEGLALC
jgi:hypothetical protein